jgi:DNA-binding transcriptional regulator YhcF (GntR family)
VSLQIDIPVDPGVPLHVRIEQELRRRIASGELAPGQRLPPAPELAAKMGVHFLTVHKALRRLKAAGLLSRTPGVGTFVRESTDRLVLGVMFGPSLSDEPSHYYRAMLREFEAQMGGKGWVCRAYDGLNAGDAPSGLPKTAAYHRFEEDKLGHRFGGLVSVGLGGKHWQRITSENHVTGARFAQTMEGMDVTVDYHDFTYRCVERLARQGRRRVVYLRTFHPSRGRTEDADGFLDAAKEFGIADFAIEEIEMDHGGHFDEAQAHKRGLSLIQEWRRTGKWADGLVISDDVAMRGLSLAMCAAGAEATRRVRVASLAIEGIDHHYGIPIERYQFSPREIVANILEVLAHRLEGTETGPLPRVLRGRMLPSPPVS